MRASFRDKIAKVMHEGKAGTLHSGSKCGPMVKHGSAQEMAIAMSEARAAGERVPPPPPHKGGTKKHKRGKPA